MKPYDLVIANSFEELIEVTNEAFDCGYTAVGGMIYIESEQKFIQTIKLKNKNTMSDFFKELAELLQDGQRLQLDVTKTGTKISVFSATRGATDFTAVGTPQEFDSEFIPQLKQELEQKTFKFTVVKNENLESENEEDQDQEDEKPVANKKADVTKKKNEYATKSRTAKKEMKAVDKKADPEEAESADDITDVEFEDAPEIKKEEPIAPKTTEPKKVTEKPEIKKDNEFTVLMHEGKKLLAGREYEKALASFAKAREIKPDDQEAKTQFELTEKWIKRVAAL